MEDKTKQDELITFFEKNNYDKSVIDQARKDFEAGLSAEQVSIYKVRRIKDKERKLISKAMRLNMPLELVTDMVNHKYKLPQYVAVINEFESGTDISVIRDVMKEFRFGHDINETISQIKDRMANSKEKPAEPEKVDVDSSISEEPETSKEESTDSTVITQPSIGTKEFLDSVRMMVDAFSDTMQKQFERMDKRDEELRQAHDREAENSLNSRITELEKELSDSKKDLSAASGVVSDKEQLIRSMQSDMDNKAKELSIKEEEIKKLREEMEQMKAGNVSAVISDNTHSASDNNSVVIGGTSPTGHTVSEDGAGIPKVSPNHTGNYTMNLTMANGKQIPIQVERTERKSPFGISALMSKLLPKGPAKTLLTRMIEGRYSGEQLAEIVYAYDNKLNEAEVKELLDANLPAEEMHGIINVVAAAKGGEE